MKKYKLRKFELVKKMFGCDYTAMMGFMMEEFVEDWVSLMRTHFPEGRIILTGHAVEDDYELMIVPPKQSGDEK